MHIELAILRAMLRLSRRRIGCNPDTLLVRVGGTEAELRIALRSLAAAGFIERLRTGDCRLTMAGLAVAVAQVAPIKTQRARRAPARRRAA